METHVSPLHSYCIFVSPQTWFCSCALYLAQNMSMNQAVWVLLFSFVFITGYSRLDFSFTCIIGVSHKPFFRVWLDNASCFAMSLEPKHGKKKFLFAPFLRGASSPWTKILFLNLKRFPQGLSWLYLVQQPWLSRTQLFPPQRIQLCLRPTAWSPWLEILWKAGETTWSLLTG